MLNNSRMERRLMNIAVVLYRQEFIDVEFFKGFLGFKSYLKLSIPLAGCKAWQEKNVFVIKNVQRMYKNYCNE